MLLMFEAYIQTLLHPFLIHDYRNYDIPLPGSDLTLPKLTFGESIMISWPLIILRRTIEVVLVALFYRVGVQSFFSGGGNSSDWQLAISENSGHFFQTLMLWSLVFSVIFYPLITYLKGQLFKLYFQAMADFCESRLPASQVATNVLVGAQSSEILLLIPLVGDAIYSLAQFFFIYAGLRKNLELSPFACFFIAMLPSLLVIGLVITLFVATIAVFF